MQKELAGAVARARPRVRKVREGRRDNWGKLRTANYLAYVSWTQMRQRCLDKGCPSYPRYGGAGITIAPQWDSFEQFLADMGPRPSKATTLDRIDNDGGYWPGNCRWASWTTQARNRGTSKWYLLNGRRVLLGDICAYMGIKYSTADMRLRRGWPMYCAFLSP